MKLSPLFTALACFALAQTPLTARSQSSDITDDPDPINSTDQNFLMTTAQGLRTEVTLGRLAQSLAADSGVKQFGKLMIRDHSADYTALVALAQEEGVTLPEGLSSDQQAEYEKLQSLSGAAFDQEYISFEIQDHRMDIHDFTEEVRNGRDFDVRRYASNSITELLEHLYFAKSVARAIGANSQ